MPKHVKINRYNINNITTSAVQLYVTPTKFINFPNLITQFTTTTNLYSRFTR